MQAERQMCQNPYLNQHKLGIEFVNTLDETKHTHTQFVEQIFVYILFGTKLFDPNKYFTILGKILKC